MMKKKWPAIIFFFVLALIIWKLEPEENNIVEKIEKDQQRVIASIKKDQKKITNKTLVKTQKKEFHLKNKKIEKELLTYYQSIFENDVKVSFHFEKETQAEGRPAKIYKITLDKGKGNTSKFMALIDEETSSILKTWNHTRYEFKKGLRISGAGREFYSL